MIPIHILVVDDDHDAALSLSALLVASDDVSVDISFDGLQAIALARARHPNLVLMDVEMPSMTGVDAATVIRLARFDPPPAICAVTGNRNSIEAAGASGTFDHVMGKPIPIRELEGLINAVRSALADAHAQKDLSIGVSSGV